MKRFSLAVLVAACCFLFLAGDAQAGPIRNAAAAAKERREARRGSTGSNCSQCAGCQVPASAPGVHAAKPTTLTVGDCPDGKCPAQGGRRGLFGRGR